MKHNLSKNLYTGVPLTLCYDKKKHNAKTFEFNNRYLHVNKEKKDLIDKNAHVFTQIPRKDK